MASDAFYQVSRVYFTRHPSPHQHSTFGYLDDVEEGGDATLMQLNSNLLALTGDVRVQS